MDRGRAIVDELKKAGISHVAWLPDSDTHFMQEAISSYPEIDIVQVCKEGEAVGICFGLHLAGKRSAMLIKNLGMFESGDVLGWVTGLEIPMLLLVGHKNYSYEENPMVRTKKYTETFLSMLGIPYYVVDSDEDVKKVAIACKEAWHARKPVAVLLTKADTFVPGS